MSELRYRVSAVIDLGRDGEDVEIAYFATMADAVRALLDWSCVTCDAIVFDQKQERHVAELAREYRGGRVTDVEFRFPRSRGWRDFRVVSVPLRQLRARLCAEVA